MKQKNIYLSFVKFLFKYDKNIWMLLIFYLIPLFVGVLIGSLNTITFQSFIFRYDAYFSIIYFSLVFFLYFRKKKINTSEGFRLILQIELFFGICSTVLELVMNTKFYGASWLYNLGTLINFPTQAFISSLYLWGVYNILVMKKNKIIKLIKPYLLFVVTLFIIQLLFYYINKDFSFNVNVIKELIFGGFIGVGLYCGYNLIPQKFKKVGKIVLFSVVGFIIFFIEFINGLLLFYFPIDDYMTMNLGTLFLINLKFLLEFFIFGVLLDKLKV